MKTYLDALASILRDGETRDDRTGIGTISKFGMQMRFDLSESFPAVTTKKLAWKSVVSELLWFIEGSDDERRLAEIHYGKSRFDLIGKTTIWTANADNQGKALGYENTDIYKHLGPIYGVQWRGSRYSDPEGRFEDVYDDDIDQLANLIKGLQNNPESRRHILSSWNVELINAMALPPCHLLAQFHVSGNKLSCQMYQRSADFFLGVPFNIASYALLMHIIAACTGLVAHEFIWIGGDCHIYQNHIDQVKEQLSRNPLPPPTLHMNPNKVNIDTFRVDDFELVNYKHHDPIKAEMAV